MKTPRLIVLAALSAAALLPTGGPRAVQAPGGPGDHTYCAYSSSARSTSASPPGGSCSTTSATPNSA